MKKSERDEIRRKLATDVDSDDYIPDYLKKASSKSHLGDKILRFKIDKIFKINI
jgi:hypothetical protein